MNIPLLPILPILTSLFAHAHASSNSTTPTPTLNITAISAADGKSTLECWQLGQFASSSVPGTVGALSLFLGATSNTSVTVLPPRFDGGLHAAPVVQYVWFTAGLAHVTLPHSDDEAWIQGGKYGLIIAADTADRADGHYTRYPSGADTIGFLVPTWEGRIPEHRVLHSGACEWEDMSGI